MKVKGKRIINSEDALEFANTIRGQYIISQALVIANNVLEKYEVDGDVTRAEPSNRFDMETLIKAFPLYKIHEEAIWKEKVNEENSS
tara:strand:+ start:168 stop:428 length:261 start_codon:yes stop_codon:yes gene_type:complete